MCVHACVPARETYLGERKRVKKGECDAYGNVHTYIYYINIYTIIHVRRGNAQGQNELSLGWRTIRRVFAENTQDSVYGVSGC